MNGVLKNALAAVCALCGLLFGDRDGMMTALIALIILDYLSGVIAAVTEKKLSSEVGARGIAKKVFMLLIVAVANIVDINVIGEGHVLKTVTVIFYIANECISLIENAGRLGVPVPNKLLEVLEQLKTGEK
ncbi:MAG: phage holin family protein [Ruminococcus sp.]|nr:phage holin family protein [Ruminococcus sp.]MCM1382551.1 phage holin family protein [Muribaculaceae bacterium]MCM1479174.1 phage holin family protein [Muribaculaceae bacterium]